MKAGIVIAWRKGENDLQATAEDAAHSTGRGVNIYKVEDTTAAGPAQTRHRGIAAAGECDVIVILDAHMRFQGDVLRRMVKEVRANGGLLCPLCHHNADCSFDAHGGSYYAGAEIVYRAAWRAGEREERHALCWKWSTDSKPGPRGCVGGACYVFRRDWYMSAGQPLAALPGWGCDEEALSIAAWMSGAQPTVFDGHVAHRWRAAPPWPVGSQEHAAVHASRMALIHAVVADAAARAELEQWQRSWVREGVPSCKSKEAERFRVALLKQPRTWAQWRAAVCKPDVIETGKAPTATPTVPLTPPRAQYGPDENGRRCPRCQSTASEITRTKQTGRMVIRYRKCKDCGHPRTTTEIYDSTPTT